MPSLIDIRRRIRSVKNTQQITKAMKMVSAAKLRRAQDRVLSSRPYATLLRKVLGNVAAAVADDENAGQNPLLARRPLVPLRGHSRRLARQRRQGPLPPGRLSVTQSRSTRNSDQALSPPWS